MGDPARAREMGQIGRERIETMFAWSHQRKCLLAAYETITKDSLENYA
jgi:hypothetical protein